MKKNGFIATSLIYSFFLVFCALVVSFVSANVSNKVLLRKEIEAIREDINSQKFLKDAQIGTYIRISLKNELITDFNQINYIIVKQDNTNSKTLVMPVIDIINAYKPTYSITNLDFKNLVNKEISNPNESASCYDSQDDISPLDKEIKEAIQNSEYLKNLLILENNEILGYLSSQVDTNNISYYQLKAEAAEPQASDNYYQLRPYVKIDSSKKILAGDGTKGSPFFVEGCAYEQ